MIKKLIFFVLLLWHVTGFATDKQPEVITLKNRPASEVLPLIKPFIGQQQVTTDGFKLIIFASPKTVDMLKEVIKEIDTPPPQLLISLQNKPDPDNPSSRQNGQSWKTRSRIPSETRTLAINNGTEGDLNIQLNIPVLTIVDTPFGLGNAYQYHAIKEKWHVQATMDPEEEKVFLKINATQVDPPISTLLSLLPPPTVGAPQQDPDENLSSISSDSPAVLPSPPPNTQTETQVTLTIPLSTWVPISARFESQSGVQFQALTPEKATSSSHQITYSTEPKPDEPHPEVAWIRVDLIK